MGLDLEPGELPGSVSTTVYRVVQEGLTNVVRHSSARSAAVVVRREARARGSPGDRRWHPHGVAGPGGGRGLTGLRERLALFDGTLESESTPQGWRLEARIPLGENP